MVTLPKTQSLGIQTRSQQERKMKIGQIWHLRFGTLHFGYQSRIKPVSFR